MPKQHSRKLWIKIAVYHGFRGTRSTNVYSRRPRHAGSRDRYSESAAKHLIRAELTRLCIARDRGPVAQKSRLSPLLLLLAHSEQILQRKLQDSWIGTGSDLAEGIAGEIGVWILLPKAIGHVERFGSKLQPLSFVEIKYSRQCEIKLPSGRAQNTVAAEVSDST